MRVLLVEDEGIVRFYLKATLMTINGEVVDAKSGEEAIKLLEDESQHFDIIITDIKMGKIDGFDVIDKAEELGRKVKFIIESAYIETDPRMNKYKEKVTAFLRKPIDLNVLEPIIRQLENTL